MPTFDCPKCGTSLDASPNKAGRRIACNNCGHQFILPQVVQYPEPAVTASPFDFDEPNQYEQDEGDWDSDNDDGEDEDEFVLNGRRVSWETYTGTAEGVRKESNTRVYGSGAIYKGTGGMHVGSYVERNTEFFIATRNGEEFAYFVDDANLMIRGGHRVTAIHASGRRTVWVALVNHTTRQVFYPNPDEFVLREIGAMPTPRWDLSILEVALFLFAIVVALIGVAFNKRSPNGAIVVLFGLLIAVVPIGILEFRFRNRIARTIGRFHRALRRVRRGL